MEQAVHRPYEINSIDDVFTLLKKALNDELDHFDLKINSLENFSMYLKGDQFHQTITPSVMKGFLDLQSAIYRSYALIKYDETNILKLSKTEKRALEIEVKVIEGSSGLGINWQELFTKFIQETVGKMSSKQVFISTLIAIASIAGTVITTSHIESLKEVRLAEIELEKNLAEKQERLATIALAQNRSLEETQTLLATAISSTPKGAAIVEEAKNATHSLIRGAQAAEVIKFGNGDVQLTGEAALELTKTTPSKWTEKRIDGIYHIINVDSSHAAKRRIRIRNNETQQETIAILENDTLDASYLNIIKEAEWSYAPVFLKVQAKELNGEYKEARIREARNIEP